MAAPAKVVPRRHGDGERLYVETARGAVLGWFCVDTAETRITALGDRASVEAALVEYQRELGLAASIEGDGDRPSKPTEDLAERRPGASARARADEELAAMRSRAPIAAAFLHLLRADSPERSWRVGAAGEETVGRCLERLDKYGWHVLHGVPVGTHGADIDHVLIGPGGVFTINTKLHPRKKIWVGEQQIRVDGRPVPYLRNARYEATRASRLLSAAVEISVEARPTLVLLTRTMLPRVTIKHGPADVIVLDRWDVPGIFRRAERRLDDAAIATIYEAARRPETWMGGAVPYRLRPGATRPRQMPGSRG